MAAMGKIELIIKLGIVDWVLPEELFSKTENNVYQSAIFKQDWEDFAI